MPACLLDKFFQFDAKLDTFILKNDSLSPKRMIICSQKGNLFPINDNLFPYLWQQSTSSNYIFLLMNLVCNLKAIVLSNFSFIAQLLRLEVFLVNHLHTYLIFAIFLQYFCLFFVLGEKANHFFTQSKSWTYIFR